MNKTVGSTLLSAALVCGLGLPAHAVDVPGTDPAQETQGAPVQAMTAPTPAAAAALRPALRIGSRSPAVVFVQSELGVKPASGYYGPLTTRAVRALQERHGLKVTGHVTASTWKVLLRATSTTTDPATAPAPSPTTPAPAPSTPAVAPTATSPSPQDAALKKPTLARGSRGPAVVFVQKELGVEPPTGYFGALTKAAVITLQRAHKLKPTGKVDKGTWKVVHAATQVREAPTPEAPTTPQPGAGSPAVTPTPPVLTPERAAATRPLLQRGSGPDDPAVVFVQKFLGVIPATGFFGTLTTNAVTSYQKALGLAVTASVDATTWEAILSGRVAPTTAGPVPTTPAKGIPTPQYPLPANPTAADRAVVYALAQVGKPYVLGGNGPAVFDCSGLIQQAYLSAGVKLPRLASQQRFAGTRVNIDQLLPGDLLYYQDGSSPRKGHISMYAGNGLVVEAANPRRGVRIRTLHERWYRDRFVAAVRIG
jgi:cell wall-associated NlpC family hydrolase